MARRTFSYSAVRLSASSAGRKWRNASEWPPGRAMGKAFQLTAFLYPCLVAVVGHSRQGRGWAAGVAAVQRGPVIERQTQFNNSYSLAWLAGVRLEPAPVPFQHQWSQSRGGARIDLSPRQPPAGPARKHAASMPLCAPLPIGHEQVLRSGVRLFASSVWDCCAPK